MIVAKWLMIRVCLVATLLALGFAAKIASAQPEEAAAVSPKFVTLHSFNGADGEFPQAALVQATNGDLYGMTPWGGSNCGVNGSC